MHGLKSQKKIVISPIEVGINFAKTWNLHYDGQKSSAAKIRYRANEEWPAIRGAHNVIKEEK